MDMFQTVQYYKEIFENLSLDKNNDFKNFLEKENITILEFLKSLGLNDDLIKPYNYQEIENFAMGILESSGLPIISSPLKRKRKVEYEVEDISIYNRENDSDIVIKTDQIDFNHSYDEENKSIASIVSYSLVDGNIRKKTMTTTSIFNREGKFSNLLKFFINATEILTTSEGEILKEIGYDIEITGPIGLNQFAVINRSLLCDSILSGVYSILKAIEEGKLKKDNVVIKLNIPGLQEKVSK